MALIELFVVLFRWPLILLLKVLWRLLRPPDVRQLEEKGNVRGLIKALAHKQNIRGWLRKKMFGDRSYWSPRFEMPKSVAEFVEALERILTDEGAEVRSAAAEALGRIGDARAVAPLIEAFKNESVEYCVAVAALHEIRIRNVGAVVPLIAALKDDGPTGASIRVMVLNEICDVRAVKLLVNALRDEKSSVRSAAAEALGRIGDARAVEPLIATLKDTEPTVRNVSVEALGKIRDTHAVDALISVLKDGDDDARRNSVRLLGKIGDMRAVGPLISTLGNANSDIRKLTVEALGKLGAAEPLITILQDGEWNIRQNAAVVLGKIKDKCAVEPLVEALLKDTNSNVRRAAAKSLGQIGDVSAVPPLIAALGGGDSEVRKITVEALGEINDLRAVDPLIAALKDGNDFVRKQAARALGKLNNPRAVGPLITALKNENSDVREIVAKALAKIDDQHAIEPLINAAQSGALDRETVVKIIGENADPRVLDYLINCLGYSLPLEHALVKKGDSAVTPLIETLKHQDWRVRADAVRALSHFEDPRIVSPLVDCIFEGYVKAKELLHESVKLSKEEAESDATLRETQTEKEKRRKERDAFRQARYCISGQVDSLIQAANFALNKINAPRTMEQIINAVRLNSITPNCAEAKRAEEALFRIISSASEKGDINTLREILQKGMGVNTTLKGYTPLSIVCGCKNGHIELVKMLLDLGASVNEGKRENAFISWTTSPLTEAYKRGHIGIFSLLLDNGASFQNELLYDAFKNNQIEIVKILLEHGADIEFRERGDTPLLIATELGSVELVKLLLMKGADPNVMKSEEIIDFGMFRRHTSLSIACMKGHTEIVRLLLNQGVEVRSPLEMGPVAETPILLASEYGRTDIVELLLNHGANINDRRYDIYHGERVSRSETPLMRACLGGHFNTAKLLLEKGADIHIKDSEGETAVSYAKRYPEIAKLLSQYQ